MEELDILFYNTVGMCEGLHYLFSIASKAILHVLGDETLVFQSFNQKQTLCNECRVTKNLYHAFQLPLHTTWEFPCMKVYDSIKQYAIGPRFLRVQKLKKEAFLHWKLELATQFPEEIRVKIPATAQLQLTAARKKIMLSNNRKTTSMFDTIISLPYPVILRKRAKVIPDTILSLLVCSTTYEPHPIQFWKLKPHPVESKPCTIQVPSCEIHQQCVDMAIIGDGSKLVNVHSDGHLYWWTEGPRGWISYSFVKQKKIPDKRILDEKQRKEAKKEKDFLHTPKSNLLFQQRFNLYLIFLSQMYLQHCPFLEFAFCPGYPLHIQGTSSVSENQYKSHVLFTSEYVLTN
jgi:hypothetical protein